jgi:hypothetical protein
LNWEKDKIILLMRNICQSLLFLFVLQVLSGRIYAQDKVALSENKNWSGIDTSKRLVPLSGFMVYGNGDYDFPVLDKKVFGEKIRGDQFFYEKEPVIAVEIGGFAKAYPLSMLRYYEIINDELGGVPLLLTYCSLCNSAIAYDRRLKKDGKEITLDFVYPKIVRESNMVIKDRQTQSLWQQFEGLALVGTLSGAVLTEAPFILMSYRDFYTNYPTGRILTPDSDPRMQFYKGYLMNPDVGYADVESEPHFYTKKTDPRLPPKEPVLSLKMDDKFFVFPHSLLSKENPFQDKIAGTDVVIFYSSGMVSILDKQEIRVSKDVGYGVAYSSVVKGKTLKFEKFETGFKDTKTSSIWNILGKCIEGKYVGESLQKLDFQETFAFAILAFHPEAVVYEEKRKKK